MSDVVLLDSDDEVESKLDVDSNKNLSKKEEDTSIITMSHAGEDDIMVEYNHNDYADLVGPLKGSPSVASPGGNVSVKTTSNATSISSGPKRLPIPKRPGSMPPFALFSQEMRAKLQKEDPDIGFGDLGRKLGEMWHALKEDEKEEYRKKARQVAEQRMRSYNEQMKNMSPQKRAMVENQQRMNLNKIKKKRTSGYAIFCSEYRRKLAQEQPDLPFADISKTVADDWKLLSMDQRTSYENRAQRFNMEEERKWRQRMMSQQSQQARIRQMSPGVRGRGLPQRGMMSGRGVANNHQIRGRSSVSVVNRRGQYRPASAQQTNNSGLVIASVSSLSASSTSQSNYNLPSGISISKSADPDINLPNSISISRVEPDIQIVEENLPNKPQRRIMGSTIVTRGRGVSLRGQGPQFRGVMINAANRMPYSRGRASPMMSTRGRGMPISPAVKRMPSHVSPVRRMGSIMMNPSPMKRPRMTYPNTQAGFNQTGFNQAGAVNPSTLDSVGRLCRICGVSSPVIFKLNDRRELVSKVNRVLTLELDLDTDVQNGYPGVICRKCTNLVETFHNFQLTVSEGQKTLLKQVEAKRARMASSNSIVELKEDNLVDEPESIGVDPLESNDNFNSIFPDDTEIDTVMIKEEKIGGSASSTHKPVASTSKKVSTISSSAVSTIAPMTAVFTDAVSIKEEPGIPAIKKEAGDVVVATQKSSGEVANDSSEDIANAKDDNNDVDCEKVPESIEITALSSNQTKSEETQEVKNSGSDGMEDTEDIEGEPGIPVISGEAGGVVDSFQENSREVENASADVDLNEEEKEEGKNSDGMEDTEPEKEKEEAMIIEDQDNSNNKNLNSNEGNEDFGGLFSDYPGWQVDDSQEDGAVGEEHMEDDWLTRDDEFDDSGDVPEMTDLGSEERDQLCELDKIADPLFEMEESDYCLVDEKNGLDALDSEDSKNEAEQNSTEVPSGEDIDGRTEKSANDSEDSKNELEQNSTDIPPDEDNDGTTENCEVTNGTQ